MNNSLKYKSCDFAIMAFPIVLDIENEYTETIFTTSYCSTMYIQRNAPIVCPVQCILEK